MEMPNPGRFTTPAGHRKIERALGLTAVLGLTVACRPFDLFFRVVP